MRRTFLCGTVLAAALFWSEPAHAQFLNRSLGVSVGYDNFLLGPPSTSGKQSDGYQLLSWGLPVGISGSMYLENSFEVTGHFHAMILVNPLTQQQYFGLMPSLGVRYLLSSENFRPYVGIDLTWLYFFLSPDPNSTVQTNSSYLGIGPNVGFEYFPQDSYSVGARLQYNLYWWLNQDVHGSLGLTAEIAWYF